MRTVNEIKAMEQSKNRTFKKEVYDKLYKSTLNKVKKDIYKQLEPMIRDGELETRTLEVCPSRSLLFKGLLPRDSFGDYKALAFFERYKRFDIYKDEKYLEKLKEIEHRLIPDLNLYTGDFQKIEVDDEGNIISYVNRSPYKVFKSRYGQRLAIEDIFLMATMLSKLPMESLRKVINGNIYERNRVTKLLIDIIGTQGFLDEISPDFYQYTSDLMDYVFNLSEAIPKKRLTYNLLVE